MKGLLILILSIISISLWGQMEEDSVIKNYYKLTRKKSWKPVSEEKDSFQLNIIDGILKDSSNYFHMVNKDDWSSIQAYNKHIESITSEFHFIDLDGDNDLDIIYQGMKGAALETELILIFINDSSQYQKKVKTNGRIVHYEKKKQIIIYKYPCCAMITNELVAFTVKTNHISESFSLLFLDSPLLHTFHSNSSNQDQYRHIMPKKMRKGKDYEVISGTRINIIPQDSILYPTYVDKNMIGEIAKNIIVTEYGKDIDNEGKIWLYCKIPLAFISYPTWEIKNISKKTKLFGWINLIK